MGLFDNLFKEKSSDKMSTKQEAFLGILLAVATADGHLADEEASEVFRPVVRMRLFEDTSRDDIQSYVTKIIKIIKKEGSEAVIDKCVPALPKELHAAVFAHACEVILADGVVETEEKAILEKLQKKLELSVAEAKDIVRVIMIKYRG
ncbi:MAG: tellurite resistance TerB family protein [Gemmataceae bacterium]|nr:tellurite resistance TerB family protein [Gemmata sp.]MDW8198241.1 tellurite resistance TerB family protein [Gemmataceae bacterium]